VFWYKTWQSFKALVYRTEKSIEMLWESKQSHITHINKVSNLRNWREKVNNDYDFLLTRFACYLLAQNWSSKIREIAHAQAYFAQQTRKQELYQEYLENQERLNIRKELTKEQKWLMSTAKECGVFNYGTFNDAWYRWLYWLRARNIKKLKWIWKDSINDRSSITELAANLFRITQTNEKLKKDWIKSQKYSEGTHFMIWGKIRDTIKDIGWVTPENLPAVEHIRETKKKIKESEKLFWEIKQSKIAPKK
jgi:DNA-damage-inducible protein D